ncbi:MAG: glycosyl transferase [Leptolyngbya foveolarum]|uniref:Glycosyl transferase n=1 Tax=Leptolyngbya foveolarum TaxID=47253 RepID=A0A2W4TUQ8_9CYAN|nr:MAG: glycosyl transferase [Leptolyngbya foveolarum]
MPNISVIIPTYNCQQYLTQAIESAIAQEVSEIIVVDDGSADDTRSVVDTFSQLNFQPELRYIYQPNQGVCAARNHGIRVAQGDLVAFLDADDWYLPHKLARQASLFADDPDLGIVQSGWQRVTESEQFIAAVRPWEVAPELTLANWLRYKPVLPSALMIRKHWLVKVGGFDPEFQAAEDVELISRLAVGGCRAAWLKEVAVSYRQRSGSAMGNGLIQARDLAKFLDKFFQQPNLPAAAQLLESSVRYHTLVWAAWYLQSTGYRLEMADYLQRSWHYSPYLPTEALAHWIESFDSFSRAAGSPIDIGALLDSSDWQKLVRWLLLQKHL